MDETTSTNGVLTDDVLSGRRVNTDSAEAPLVEDELLVEEISIDGMCGVY